MTLTFNPRNLVRPPRRAPENGTTPHEVADTGTGTSGTSNNNKRSPVKTWFLRLAGLLVLAIVGLGALLTYEFMNHPGRLTTTPEFTGLSRTVSGNTLSSDADPSLDLSFDERFQHVGGQKFVLYRTADTEQHFFVEEHPDGSMKSLFWIQFESFLPDNDFAYDYSDSPLRLQIDDVDFFADTAPGTTSPIGLEWPGTDGALARDFLSGQGYSWPDDFAYARIVNIPDVTARSELLIIFIDDLATSGLSGESLREGGEHAQRWPEVEAAHLDRLASVMSLSRP